MWIWVTTLSTTGWNKREPCESAKTYFCKRWRHELRHRDPQVKIAPDPLPFSPALVVMWSPLPCALTLLYHYAYVGSALLLQIIYVGCCCWAQVRKYKCETYAIRRLCGSSKILLWRLSVASPVEIKTPRSRQPRTICVASSNKGNYHEASNKDLRNFW